VPHAAAPPAIPINSAPTHRVNLVRRNIMMSPPS
jgi:hypothetical protein